MSEQEEFWRGSFGNEYTERNSATEVFERKLAFWAQRFDWGLSDAPQRVIEFGAGAGLNLRALRLLAQNDGHVFKEMTGVDVNEQACAEMRAAHIPQVINCPAWDWNKEISEKGKLYDLAISMGWLIHVPPDDLQKAYFTLSRASARYVFIGEYYAPTPTPVEYRGHKDRLWRRDYAGEFMDLFPREWVLMDYGFNYHRDVSGGLDDVTWFLLERV